MVRTDIEQAIHLLISFNSNCLHRSFSQSMSTATKRTAALLLRLPLPYGRLCQCCDTQEVYPLEGLAVVPMLSAPDTPPGRLGGAERKDHVPAERPDITLSFHSVRLLQSGD
ncbi:hypothetical protein AOLI_G00098680 [Acnodon oligacanthus]